MTIRLNAAYLASTATSAVFSTGASAAAGGATGGSAGAGAAAGGYETTAKAQSYNSNQFTRDKISG